MSMHKGILGQADGGSSAKPDVTLKDYIERKLSTEAEYPFCTSCDEPVKENNKMEWPFPTSNNKVVKKLTFDEWWELQLIKHPWLRGRHKTEAASVWKAAQENM